MLAEKVLAGKSKIEDYFPEYANYTVPEDGKISELVFPDKGKELILYYNRPVIVVQTVLMILGNSINLNQPSGLLPHLRIWEY